MTLKEHIEIQEKLEQIAEDSEYFGRGIDRLSGEEFKAMARVFLSYPPEIFKAGEA